MTVPLRSPLASDGRLYAPLGERASELGAQIASRDLAALVLTSPESVYYVSGYPALPSAGNPILHALRSRLPPFAVVDRDGHVTLGCWGFSVEGVSMPVDAIAAFNSLSTSIEVLLDALRPRAAGGGHLGIESSCPTFVASAIRSELGDVISVADDVIDRLRLVKSEEEIAFLEASLEIAERSVADLYELLAPGLSRLELMGHARDLLYAHGADGVGHITFTFGQTNPEIALDEHLTEGRLVALDLGAIVAGYRSDNRRYAYGGTPTSRLADLHAKTLEIVDAVGAALTPGALYADVHRRAIELFGEYDVPLLGRFSHAGHNIGLETEELWVDDTTDEVVRPGMVINIELYALTDSGDQIGNEETYVIEDSGPRQISRLATELRSF